MRLSGLSSHTPLCKPEISVEYLKQAVPFAAECGVPAVNTRVLALGDSVDREEIVLSVECGTIDEAARSTRHLEPLLQEIAARGDARYEGEK